MLNTETTNKIDLAQNKLTYTVSEISKILSISTRSAYNLCNGETVFKVFKVGRTVRVHKASFDNWFSEGAMPAE